LELAAAYLDMDDSDGARSLLEEVMGEGDTGQKKRAKDMLERLST
jgi:pilus assembly protein FimV